IFLKGMLGIPFDDSSDASIDVAVSGLAIFIAVLVIVVSIKSPVKIRSYALLIGIAVGWGLYVLFFGGVPLVTDNIASMKFFPFGSLYWDTGIVVTAVLAGILNISNTYGALKGTDDMFRTETTKRDYAASFSITGLATVAAGLFGLVPYAPFVSSIGFLKQTAIYENIPFIIGSFLFFSTLPLSIGSAVLFVAYLQFFLSSMEFFKQISLSTLNVYRSAIPVFVGAIIMMFPDSYFDSIPTFIRPFLSNGLLVGIMLAL